MSEFCVDFPLAKICIPTLEGEHFARNSIQVNEANSVCALRFFKLELAFRS